MSLIYGAIGSTNFEVILKSLALVNYNEFFSDSCVCRVVMGSVFILISILFKLTAAPFHM
jgi:NADH:ubiquinone oxidoreductase subunit 2 (subunit N)